MEFEGFFFQTSLKINFVQIFTIFIYLFIYFTMDTIGDENFEF